ncbi:MAG: hypothetical protein HDR04_20525 [Lachnospiraceae bacterium]|nr:hypothetical protein [Lachnospiraceae bacterium]
MEEKELRELLQQRFYMELMLFKDSMLQKEKKDIFKASYKIEVFVNLYEILLVYVENLQGDMIRELLGISFGILDFLYQEWLDREDNFYEDLREYACSELEGVPRKVNPDGEKEEKDGTKPDQTA